MKKIFAICVALAMALCLSVSVFADTLFSLDHEATSGALPFGDDYEMVNPDNSWYRSVITSYMDPENTAAFLEAIQKDGAKLVLTYTGDTVPTFLMQANYNSTYPWVDFTEPESTNETADGKKQVVYDCASAIAKFTSTAREDDPSSLISLDGFMNLGVFGTGDKLYLVTVVDGAAAPAEDNTPADSAPAEDNTPADSTPADTTPEAPKDEAPAETGIVLAVLPMMAAAAAVVVSKKR